MRCRIFVTEVVKYVVMTCVLSVGVWRHAELAGYRDFPNGWNCDSDGEDVSGDCKRQYWGILAAIYVGVTLLLYLPMKCCAYTKLKDARYNGWRPSIVTYIFVCALPVLALQYHAITQTQLGKAMESLDNTTFHVITLTIIGLVITEWMAKICDEVFTYEMVSAMAQDFFFAYDVLDFFYIILHSNGMIFHSRWTAAVFLFAWFAMFKYVTSQPTNDCPDAITLRFIIVGMICNDIPFVIIRMSTMIGYGINATSIIQPLKNIAMIVLGIIQLRLLRSDRDRQRCLRDEARNHFMYI